MNTCSPFESIAVSEAVVICKPRKYNVGAIAAPHIADVANKIEVLPLSEKDDFLANGVIVVAASKYDRHDNSSGLIVCSAAFPTVETDPKHNAAPRAYKYPLDDVLLGWLAMGAQEVQKYPIFSFNLVFFFFLLT